MLDLAEKTGAPVVAILDTAGARLDEGIDAMNAYALMAGKTNALSGVVPQIALCLLYTSASRPTVEKTAVSRWSICTFT